MTPRPSPIEPLEPRIAPALVLQNPLVDFTGGAGQKTANIDLSKMFDAASTSRTRVNFVTNVDTDLVTAGLQAGVIALELYDDLTPLTVQNFLLYVNAKIAAGDYDNTIIHRTANFLGTSAADFIQGGGFEFPNLGAHIPIGLNLANEYNEALPNVRGTIAMGKLPGDPNSASSEWFINANDNSSIFGSNNSGSALGYTVFGRVLSGIEIVDTISNLTTRNLSGINSAFGAVPLQNGFTTGTPTADQYIRITDAVVIPGTAPDITYSVSVTPIGGAPAGIVKAAVKGSTLDLTFSGATGQAAITVTGKNAANETADDTFQVTLGANLAARLLSDGFQVLMVPGDTAPVKIEIANAGSANFSGPVKIEYFLSKIIPGNGSIDPDGTLLDAGDLLLTTVPSKSLSLAPGKTTAINTVVSIPPTLVDSEDFTYRILAQVTPLGGTQLNDLTTDNVARLSDEHGIFNRAGTFSAAAIRNSSGHLQFADFGNVTPGALSRDGAAILKYVQDDGNATTTDPLVTVTLKGPGVAAVNPAPGGGFNFSAIQTTVATKLGATTAKGQPRVEFRDIAVDSGVGQVDFGGVNLAGFASFAGGVQTLKLGDLTGSGGLSLGAFLPANTTKASVTLGHVRDFNFESSQPVASLTALEWLDTGGLSESLIFHGLDKLAITGAKGGTRGDLQASVELASETPVGSITVAGLLQNSLVLATGDISAITLGGIDHSSIFAGTLARPTTLADFIADRTIGKFTIKGVTGVTDLFVAAEIAAQHLGTISVQKVATSNAGLPFGFIADAIKSYNRTGGPRLSKLDLPADLTPPGQADVVGDYLVSIL